MAKKVKNKPFQAYRFIGKNCNWDESGYAMGKNVAFDVADFAFSEGVEASKQVMLDALKTAQTDFTMLLNETWELNEEGLKCTLKVLNKAIKKAEKL